MTTLIPCIGRLLPEPDWHVVRFSTWGQFFGNDRVAPGVYRATAHSFNETGYLAYGGVHATLLRASSIEGVIEYMLDRGVMPVDVALRYGTGHRQRPARSVATRSQKSRLNVWAVRSASVWTETSFRGWRAGTAAGTTATGTATGIGLGESIGESERKPGAQGAKRAKAVP